MKNVHVVFSGPFISELVDKFAVFKHSVCVALDADRWVEMQRENFNATNTLTDRVHTYQEYACVGNELYRFKQIAAEYVQHNYSRFLNHVFESIPGLDIHTVIHGLQSSMDF